MENTTSQNVNHSYDFSVDESSAVNSLLRSCASIRKRTRTCLTISQKHGTSRLHQSASKDRSQEYSREIREEEDIAAELDRKIVDYQAAIQRLDNTSKRQRRTAESQGAAEASSSKAAAKAAVQEQKIARSRLMGESLRHQQEELLLNRIAMSQPAIATAYAPSTTTGNNTAEKDEADRARKTLIREATRCRNKEVKKTLEAQRKIDEVKRQLTLESEKGRQLQQQNRILWNELQKLRDGQNPADAGQKAGLDSEEQRIADENLILKRVLSDIIVGSDLDWYHDVRLRGILLKLEH